jgi:hypothetical protein
MTDGFWDWICTGDLLYMKQECFLVGYVRTLSVSRLRKTSVRIAGVPAEI